MYVRDVCFVSGCRRHCRQSRLVCELLVSCGRCVSIVRSVLVADVIRRLLTDPALSSCQSAAEMTGEKMITDRSFILIADLFSYVH